MNDNELRTEIKKAQCSEHEHYCDNVLLKNDYKKRLDKARTYLSNRIRGIDENVKTELLQIIGE